MQIILELLAAASVSFGLTAFTTLLVGSERLKSLVAGTFAFGVLVIFMALRMTGLPTDFLLSMIAAGAVLGVGCTLLLKPVRRLFERESSRNSA